MSGDGFGINAQSVARTGYLRQMGEIKPLSPEEKQKVIDMLKRYQPLQLDDGYKTVVDKNGLPRQGRIVKNEPLTLKDMLTGKKPKELAKVKKAQVTKFLENIKALGLDLTVDDIMSKNGTLNPNFKVDEKGNISFRNIKGYLNGKNPQYFETQNGDWAQVKVYEFPKWYTLKDDEFPKGFKLEKPGYNINKYLLGNSEDAGNAKPKFNLGLAENTKFDLQ